MPLATGQPDKRLARPFDQGELHGRPVCAIFVAQPEFVEVTVHPADGGRLSEKPAQSTPAPSDGVSQTDAVDAAREALPPEAESGSRQSSR